MDGFRQMRRADRDLGEPAAYGILDRGHIGILSVYSAEGYPYGIPMNYVRRGNRIFFHIAVAEGLLADSVGDGCEACFTVVETIDESAHRSAVCFGNLSFIGSMEADILEAMIDKYVRLADRDTAKRGIPSAERRVRILEFDIDHISGKYVDRPVGR